MITINKEEAMALIAKYGDDANIAITGRSKKGGRKKYYASEERHIVNFIKNFRKEHFLTLLKEG